MITKQQKIELQKEQAEIIKELTRLRDKVWDYWGKDGDDLVEMADRVISFLNKLP